jgi:hypothetical protein
VNSVNGFLQEVRAREVGPTRVLEAWFYPSGYVNVWPAEDTVPFREVSLFGVTGAAGNMEPFPVSEVINSYPFCIATLSEYRAAFRSSARHALAHTANRSQGP